MKTAVELFASGPGGAPVRVRFPFRRRHLEFAGGQISYRVPVTLRYRTRIEGRLPSVVRALERRLKIHGYRHSVERVPFAGNGEA